MIYIRYGTTMTLNLRTLVLKNKQNLVNVFIPRSLHITSSVKDETLLPWNKVQLNNNFPTKYNNKFILEPNVIKLTSAVRYIFTSKILMDKSEVKLSRKEQLKKAVKDYGSTVIVFHITISLASLGFFYLLISSGIDMQQVMTYFGVNYKFAENAGTFVTAYAIHKLFAPVRISITLGATPFIVKYLRNKGILRKTRG